MKSASLIEPVTRLRLHLLEYRYALQAKFGGMALNVLQKIQDLSDSCEVKFLLLPNQTQFRQIDIEMINQERGKLLNYRQLAIDVKREFDKMRIEQVIPTLLTFRIENFESDQMSATKQTEMLLDCFWEDECDADGVLLAEAALYESMNVWMLHAGCDDKALSWIGDHIAFILNRLVRFLQTDSNCKQKKEVICFGFVSNYSILFYFQCLSICKQ